jgi:signal transduction histidine kinase/putative methionine-R-sulfoxide reductase with GAF domain
MAVTGTALEPARSRLSEFLRDRQAEIIAKWTERMRSMFPASSLSDAAIVDHLPKILSRIGEIVASVHTGRSVTLESLPRDHAVDRLGRGFDLDQIVTEYSLLRRCIFDLWEAHIGATIDLAELRNFDTAFDESIRQSAVRYAQAREKLLKALDRVSEAALGSGDVETFLHGLLRATLEGTQSVDTAVVLLREGDTFRLRAAVGLEEELQREFSMNIGEGFAGHVAAEGHPVFLRDAAVDVHVKSEVIRDKGVRALYGVPLVRDAKVIGVTYIGSLTAFEFSDEDKLLFRTMASRATSVVVKAQLLADLTRAESAQRFLSEASKQLARSLDYEATLDQTVRLAVSAIADWCVVDLIQDGTLRRVAAASDPDKETLARRLGALYPPDPNASTGIANALRTARPELHADVTDAEVAALARDEEDLRILRGLGLRAYIVVPIVAHQKVLGAITLVTTGSHRRYSEDDVLIAQDLAGRVATAIENAHLYAEAQNAIQLREQMLAIVSHDLRNQLGVIATGANLLGLKLSALNDPVDVKKPIETIQRTVSNMQHLLGDLLDMASIQAGRLSIEPHPAAIKPILVESCENHQPMARAMGLHLVLDAPADGVRVRCDRGRILQVLANLLGNAIKFCETGDAITLRAEERGHELLIAVNDTGPGISQDEVQTLFEPYRTITRHERTGTGLGLYIVKGIVERHRGRVWVESVVGVGTTFFFTLPRP